MSNKKNNNNNNDFLKFKGDNGNSLGEVTNIMVIDIGTMFIKYSLFVNYDGLRDYLVKFDMKYMNEIYVNGELNFNLLERDFKRKVEVYKKYGEIDLLVVIPPKLYNEGSTIPRFEYREKYSEYKENIKKEFKELGIEGNTFDWIKTADVPEEDYQSILIDSIPNNLIMDLSRVILTLNIKQFVITSPLVGYLNIFDDDKPHAIIDIGHTRTRIAIVKNGTMYSYNDSTKAGYDFNEALNEEGRSYFEVLTLKHNSNLSELPTSINEVIEGIREVINLSINDFTNRYDEEINDYCIVGGSAGFSLEEDFNIQTIGASRVYPPMNLENDNLLPMEVRNYLYKSYGTYKYFLHNRKDKEKVIDFSASKSGGIGLKVKTISRIYDSYKTPLIVGLAGLYFTVGLLSYASKVADEYNSEVQALQTRYQNELSTAQNNVDQINAEIADLNSRNVHVDLKDTGELLKRLKEITPPKFNVTKIDLNGRGDSGKIIIKTESQVMVSAFITLLQDPSNGIFQRANIIDIQIVESLGDKYYQTTIFVEGRKI